MWEIKIKDKQKTEIVLRNNGFFPKWDGDVLVVNKSNYDEIYDILYDNDLI